MTSYMNKENIQANACGVVHTERQHRTYIVQTIPTCTYKRQEVVREREREKERKKERKKEKERGKERVSV